MGRVGLSGADDAIATEHRPRLPANGPRLRPFAANLVYRLVYFLVYRGERCGVKYLKLQHKNIRKYAGAP